LVSQTVVVSACVSVSDVHGLLLNGTGDGVPHCVVLRESIHRHAESLRLCLSVFADHVVTVVSDRDVAASVSVSTAAVAISAAAGAVSATSVAAASISIAAASVAAAVSATSAAASAAAVVSSVVSAAVAVVVMVTAGVAVVVVVMAAVGVVSATIVFVVSAAAFLSPFVHESVMMPVVMAAVLMLVVPVVVSVLVLAATSGVAATAVFVAVVTAAAMVVSAAAAAARTFVGIVPGGDLVPLLSLLLFELLVHGGDFSFLRCVRRGFGFEGSGLRLLGCGFFFCQFVDVGIFFYFVGVRFLFSLTGSLARSFDSLLLWSVIIFFRFGSCNVIFSCSF